MRRLVGRLALAGVFLAASGGVAVAYTNEPPIQLWLTGPTGTLHCRTWYTVRATLTNLGEPVVGTLVLWVLQTKLPGDQISPSQSTTDAHGSATTRVRLACLPGPRIVRARTEGIIGLLVLPLARAGLPRTSTAHPAGAPTNRFSRTRVSRD